MAEISTIDFALFYASRGFEIFPVDREKHPLVKWSTEATKDERKIKQWWLKDFPEAGIAITTGARSGIQVVDIDPKNGGDNSYFQLLLEWGELPATAEVQTGGGGKHIYFVHPGGTIGNSASKLAPGIDTRGDGGYVVAPPSIHHTGRRYEWISGRKLSQTPLAEMPRWMIQKLVPELVGGEKPHQAPVVDNYITDGARNQTLTSLAGTMRRRGFGHDAIFQALMTENNNKCRPPLTHDEVMSITKSVSRYEPSAPPVYAGEEKPPTRDPLDAYGAGVAFMDLLENLDGRSIPTYIKSVDNSIGGIERQTLSILAARPSMGKSTLAWQIARNVAQQGKKAYFFSLEMSAAALWAKAACGELGIRWRDVRNGQRDDDTIKMLLDKTSDLMHRYGECLLIDDGVNTSETIWKAIEKHKPDLVIVDHLRLLADRGDREHKRLGVITQRLKEAAKAFNCGMFVCAQLNRGVEDRESKRPLLSDLRDSGEIEENADLVLMMHNQSYYEDIKDKEPMTELLVRKFRDDVRNQIIKLIFDTVHQSFESTRDFDLSTMEWKR